MKEIEDSIVAGSLQDAIQRKEVFKAVLKIIVTRVQPEDLRSRLCSRMVLLRVDSLEDFASLLHEQMERQQDAAAIND